jgi:hypothetical protein
MRMQGTFLGTSGSSLFTIMLSLGLVPLVASAQLNELKLAADDATGGDHYGRTMAMSGDRIAIGAMTTNGGRGAVYIYDRSGDDWLLDEKIDSPGRSAFGRSIGLDGDYLVVTLCKMAGGGICQPASSGFGVAYFYDREDSGWVLVDQFDHNRDAFATSAGLSGDVAVIGADGDDDVATDAGAAYIYRRSGDNWVEEAKLTASDGQSGDNFGYSAAISGDYALIGAWNASGSQGAAYIFEYQAGAWVEAAKLVADDGAAGDQFGSWFLDIDGDYAVVGALNDDDLGTNAGSAYIFYRDADGNWSQQAKLLASNGITDDQFGTSAAISGNFALIGSFDGAYAYLFERIGESWVERYVITSSDYETGDDFAYALAMDGAYAAIGADDDVINGTETGSAYVYWGYTQSEPAVVVSNIPGQTIDVGGAFDTIALDDYVSHDTYGDEEMVWTVTGQIELDVTIDTERVASVTAPVDWTGTETVTFEATAPDSTTDSDDASFTVNDPTAVAPSDLAVSFTGTVATLTWEGSATDISCTSLSDTVTGNSYDITFPDDIGYMLPQTCSVSNAIGSSNVTGRFGCRTATTCIAP